jgi:hypothetical protein
MVVDRSSMRGLALTASLANSIRKLGYEFEWIKDASDFDKADVSGSSEKRGKPWLTL